MGARWCCGSGASRPPGPPTDEGVSKGVASMPEQPVPLSELSRDLPEPAAGWAAEMAARGVEVVLDDLGRAAISRRAARLLFTEHLAQEELAARRRAEVEEQVVAADAARRAALPRGIPAGSLPEGVSAGLAMMLADPERQESKRESVLEHSLNHPAGALVYHSLQPEGAS
jgi:ParB-like chromosome segregation protein Spo0J